MIGPHDVAVAIADRWTTATSEYASVTVVDGPPGRELYEDVIVGVGITPQENLPPIESTPTATGAGTNIDELVIVRCWCQVSETGADVATVRQRLVGVMSDLEGAIQADMTLGGIAGMATMPGVQRYFQGRTSESTFVEVFFDVSVMLYR